MDAIVATWLLAASAASALPSAIPIAIHAEAVVRGPVIRMSDVADLAALRSADPNLASRIAALRIAVVRANQDRVVFDSGELGRVIRQAAQTHAGRLSISAEAASVVVVPATRVLDPLALQRAAVKRLLDACASVASDCSVDAARLQESAVRLPLGTVSLEPVLPARWSEGSSALEIPVRISVDGEGVGSLRVLVTWRATREAWVLTASVDRGQTIRQRDIQPTFVPAGDVRTSGVAYDSVARLIRATQPLEAGTVLMPVDARVVAQFRRGDEVPIALQVGPVRVLRLATAVQDGRSGSGAFVRVGTDGLVAARVPERASTAEEQGEQR